MKKGIAIPYIIALIIGIVVVGVIGYWFFGLAGKGSGVGTTVGCDAKTLSYCQALRDVGWGFEPPFQSWDESCGKKPDTIPDYCAKKLGGFTCKCELESACKSSGYNSIFTTTFSDCGTFCCK